MTWFSRIGSSRERPERLVAGLMSGTSMDSIDVALCRIRGGGRRASVDLLRLHCASYDPALRAALKRIEMVGFREVAELHARVGDAFADALLEGCRAAGVEASDVDVVGSHGQTVYHHSGFENAMPATLQLGDGDRIAERTGLPVISDFRVRDVAAGGEGAPLTPYGDLALFPPAPGTRRVVLNLGGIANITVLDAETGDVFGFDTGPANGPLDRLAAIISNGALSFDEDGKIAASGHVDEAILERLLTEDPYLRRTPPKSTGFEMYGDEFVRRLIALRGGVVDARLLRTAVEFSSRTVAEAIKRHVRPPVGDVVIAGGGARNPVLIAALREQLDPIPLRFSDELGVPAGAREAICFALLANDALLGLPTSLPSVTGARRRAVLGKLSFPSVADE